MDYNRDAVVPCITRHYELLLRLAHLESGDIRYPPPWGWDDEQLVVDVLRYCGRSDAVIDLLCRPLYARLPRSPATRYVDLETRSVSYLGGQGLFAGAEPGVRASRPPNFTASAWWTLPSCPTRRTNPPGRA